MSSFRFKQFEVCHDRCAMKVGTDGVLLGAWCRPEKRKRILDVGTGTGLIALMIAQRNSEAIIHALEIDEDAVGQARENVANCKFAGRIIVEKADFACFQGSELYDMIVSNPPYYEANTHSPNTARDVARSTNSLPFSMLIKNVSRLLSSDGVFSVVIPTEATSKFIALCAENGLYLSDRTLVADSPLQPLKRTLMSFVRRAVPTIRTEVYLHTAEGLPTSYFRNLTSDFYYCE